MTDSFLGEIGLFAFGKTPQGWLPCDGTILQTSAFAALFSLLSNQYGGDGRTTFALPDLRGRVLVGYGTTPANNSIGGGTYLPIGTAGMGGSETVALTLAQIPAHNHGFTYSTVNPPSSGAIANSVLSISQKTASTPSAAPNAPDYYAAPTATSNLVALAAASLAPTGANQPHENRQPFLALQYCICINGAYPQRD